MPSQEECPRFGERPSFRPRVDVKNLETRCPWDGVEETVSENDSIDQSSSEDAGPGEVNTPVTRKRLRAVARLDSNGDADDSDQDNYKRQQKEVAIDQKDGNYVEVED